MKIIILFLNFLICFSKLIDSVRKDIVKKALLKLPKRGSLDVLKMSLQMSTSKSTYSLNDEESAYLVHKWIVQNIEFDSVSEKLGNSSTAVSTVYNTGKGGVTGITALFKTMCDHLKIKADTIPGLTKTLSDSKPKKIITKKYSWNYISINNKNYLIDVVMSIELEKIRKRDSDFYFGMDPEAAIHFHFPNDNKWQLLSKTITKKEFESMALLEEGFYTLGLKTISPDIHSLNMTRRSIRLTSDKSFDQIFDQLEFVELMSLPEDDLPWIDNVDFKKISNGNYSFTYYLSSGSHTIIYARNIKTGEVFDLFKYDGI